MGKDVTRVVAWRVRKTFWNLWMECDIADTFSSDFQPPLIERKVLLFDTANLCSCIGASTSNDFQTSSCNGPQTPLTPNMHFTPYKTVCRCSLGDGGGI